MTVSAAARRTQPDNMAREIPQVTLLRVAAFVVDALMFALLLILPASVASYIAALTGSVRAITMAWYVALLLLLVAILLRDGYRHRSPGKRLLGLTIAVRSGGRCGYLRSLVRNLPLLIPPLNVVEVFLVLFTRRSRRIGDWIARTSVEEE
jgi:uncharacterized RDD family membrane protein YckC